MLQHAPSHPVLCDYCKRAALFVAGSIIYPHRPDLFKKVFYYCEPCGAWVGCHPNTAVPLGRLANRELRAAKIEAHAAFDPIWRGGAMLRNNAYHWLAQQLRLKPHECHIGMFDVAMCRRVVEVCRARSNLISAAIGSNGGAMV